jgi:hypothetical protein
MGPISTGTSRHSDKPSLNIRASENKTINQSKSEEKKQANQAKTIGLVWFDLADISGPQSWRKENLFSS